MRRIMIYPESGTCIDIAGELSMAYSGKTIFVYIGGESVLKMTYPYNDDALSDYIHFTQYGDGSAVVMDPQKIETLYEKGLPIFM